MLLNNLVCSINQLRHDNEVGYDAERTYRFRCCTMLPLEGIALVVLRNDCRNSIIASNAISIVIKAALFRMMSEHKKQTESFSVLDPLFQSVDVL